MMINASETLISGRLCGRPVTSDIRSFSLPLQFTDPGVKYQSRDSIEGNFD